MKKITLLITMVLLCLFKANAQEPKFVSTEPANRNVLIEEFTGRNCGFCPLGQKIVNNIIKNNPGRVFTVNIHSESSLSPATYPNLNTLKGADIAKAFGDGSLPQAVVNRSTEKAVGLYTTADKWAPMTNEQLQQAAECNIAGQVEINKETRLAKITVEVYYTADSKVDNNYLTVVMLQDSIIGTQKNANDNPEQVVGDQYCHMHVYRNTISEKWGNEINPTTAGTLITKTFKYTIPESIGEPNGVEVDLDNLHFLAFVTEQQGVNPFRSFPILNVCKLINKDYGTESLSEINSASCDVYPNPVKDVVTVKADNIKQIMIYNSLGQMMKSVDCNDNISDINVSDLENGIYFLNVIDNEGKISTNKISVLH